MVRVEVTGDHVSELRIDPRVMRKPADDLAAAIIDATNAAFADVKAAMTAELPDSAIVGPDGQDVERDLVAGYRRASLNANLWKAFPNLVPNATCFRWSTANSPSSTIARKHPRPPRHTAESSRWNPGTARRAFGNGSTRVRG